jgi:hypothetical protein
MPDSLHNKNAALDATVSEPEVEIETSQTRLTNVLPDLGQPWWKVRHLLSLNIRLVSSSIKSHKHTTVYCTCSVHWNIADAWKLVPITTGSTVGFDLGLMNGLFALQQWHEYFNSPKGAVLGALANGVMFGMVLGLSIVAWLNDRYGRRTSLQFGAALVVLGAALQAASQNYAMFLIARIVLGFGSIMETVSGPILISEVAYPSHRAVLTSTFFPAWYSGAFISAWVSSVIEGDLR